MLQLCPSKRPSAEDVLNHRFLDDLRDGRTVTLPIADFSDDAAKFVEQTKVRKDSTDNQEAGFIDLTSEAKAREGAQLLLGKRSRQADAGGDVDLEVIDIENQGKRQKLLQ